MQTLNDSVGDYDEALNRITTTIENRESIWQYPFVFWVIDNFWHDPMLKTPEWVEVREKLRPS